MSITPTPIHETDVWIDPSDPESYSIDASIGPIRVERWVHSGKRRSTEVSLNGPDTVHTRAFASPSEGPLVTLDLQTETAEGRFEVGGWVSPDQARDLAARLVAAADEAEALS